MKITLKNTTLEFQGTKTWTAIEPIQVIGLNANDGAFRAIDPPYQVYNRYGYLGKFALSEFTKAKQVSGMSKGATILLYSSDSMSPTSTGYIGYATVTESADNVPNDTEFDVIGYFKNHGAGFYNKVTDGVPLTDEQIASATHFIFGFMMDSTSIEDFHLYLK